MRRSVFADADRIMTEQEDDLDAHECCKPDRRAAIVTEGEIGAAIRQEAALQSDSVHCRRHSMLANPIGDVAALETGEIERRHFGGPGQDAIGQVSRAAHQFRHEFCQDPNRLLAALADRDLFRVIGEIRKSARDGSRHAGGRVSRNTAVEFRTALRRIMPLLPQAVLGRAAFAGPPPGHHEILRDLESRMRPVELLAHAGELGSSQWCPVGNGLALLCRRAEADMGARRNKDRAIGYPRRGESLVDRFQVMAVDPDRRPVRGFETLALIIGGRKTRRTIDRRAIVVEDDDEAGKPHMPGERYRFLAHTFHEAAVTTEDPDPVIDEIIAEFGIEHPFGERHADRRRDALAERPARRLDARHMTIFGMAGGARMRLAEALQLVERGARIAGQVQEPIKQHRAMAVGEDETVAIRPLGCRRIIFQMPGEQHGGEIGHAERHAGMARLRFLDGIGGKKPQGIRHLRKPHVIRKSGH